MFELNQFSHLHFLRPWWLLAFIPLLMALAYLWSASNPIGRWRRAIAPHLLEVILVRHSRTSWFNPVNVSILKCAALKS